MAWFILVIAGMMETVWAIALKYSHGFTKLWPTLIFLLAGGLSFWLLSLSLRTLPVGTAYAIWTGIGALGTVLFGMFFLGESKDWIRLVFLSLLIFSLVGLQITSET
ncbi:MAG: SMR family transporter [Firmicutes bacterium]|mgnify:FL=1|uniref:Quaternary ammonium compound-resistance protein SugE n=1 Tax=Melghirimyces thermohalophilus TaxID=1236220 RepID=A0A1G6LCH3_9BACL|nr:SMR family transporter [Melghirimyces thermohalophilus]MDA8353185.1 SMR family transporter [Bacillota bacterium]SDC40970.1 quaternary ammonium compound-resistance protein SugE [Melghirimyces thermohalophilus]